MSDSLVIYVRDSRQPVSSLELAKNVLRLELEDQAVADRLVAPVLSKADGFGGQRMDAGFRRYKLNLKPEPDIRSACFFPIKLNIGEKCGKYAAPVWILSLSSIRLIRILYRIN
ncbi:MAG: hypothetical protein U5R06_11095 [candidate division KSB1 bacterium]|nr:hypothetical protein [candidate division KSB1 bacterium]